MEKLLMAVNPFYQLLHGVLRNVLWNRIQGYEPFDKDKTMPAHMLGTNISFSLSFHLPTLQICSSVQEVCGHRAGNSIMI